ncbi:YTH domain-containing family protein like [Actinidia chinensis var. chinensis]|uniref:YTH domain-containing family protein n=1 Tax=Actinidia chinensis var. chinensis TaxID=1590841 RepID=A0A2R6S260_ACTCC|nr:YTH domain-containing family protein like [Actinidia chinensis var. chinensis]
MDEASQHGPRDRVISPSTSSAGGRPVEPNLTEKLLSPKDERIVSTIHSPDTPTTGLSREITGQLESPYSSGTLTTVHPQEQTYYYGGFENNTGNWDDYSRYVNANSLQVVSPAIYNDNPSLVFHSGYGLDTQMAYGQFSPMASPMSPIMLDGQLYSPHQIPVSPPYFPPPVSPGLPHVTSSLPASQSDMVTTGRSGQEGLGDNLLFGPGSGYFVHFGSFGGGGLSGEPLSNRLNSDMGSYLSPLTSPAIYPQPIGILGPYEHNTGQISQQQRQSHGLGLVASPSARNFHYGAPYQSSNYSTASISHWGMNDRSRFTPEKGRRREREHDSIFISVDSRGISSDHNRGPRASRPKVKNSDEESSSFGTGKSGASISGIHDLYNRPDFVTNYDNAKFFIIKSFSEDNVHKSIKYSVWASTPLGNKKLDAAYREARDMKDRCPVFLLFSVNSSGQFCGVAEMIGPVDFEKDADYWQQDRWSGQFSVQWHIIKDVPNNRFRHILLENNDNKPVTHSRDSQEVKLGQGIEILKIFKDHDAETSILDDFSYYDEREKALQERKARQRVSSTKNTLVADASVNQLSDNFAEALQLEGGKEVLRTE